MTIYDDEQASKYLQDKHGVRHAVLTLRKKRVTGGGPAFLVFNGRFCGYPQKQLDAWALERTELVTTTSEVGHGKPVKTEAAATDACLPITRAFA